MQTTTSISNEPVAQARAAVVDRPKASRLAYLDTLRVVLISLVIALHTAIAYGALGDWIYVDPASDELSGALLTLVTGVVQAFSLGLYFFIAGYFTPGSFDRKGLLHFWKDRLLRLALPMIVYTWVLNRVSAYFALTARGEETRSFGAFFVQTFLTSPDEGPTWFIFALLLFCVGYTLWRLATRLLPSSKLAWTSQLKAPGKLQILGFGLVVGVLMFLVGLVSPVNNTVAVFGIFNLMVIFFVQYILFFIAGTLAYRNDWLRRWDGKDGSFWKWFSVAMGLMMPVTFFLGGAASGKGDLFLGGPYWQSAAFMLWVGLFSVSISMALMLGLRDRKQGRLMAFAGPNTFGVYLIHPLILVPVSVAMSALPIFPLLKFVIVLPVVLVLCFLAAEGLRRIPGVKSVL